VLYSFSASDIISPMNKKLTEKQITQIAFLMFKGRERGMAG